MTGTRKPVVEVRRSQRRRRTVSAYRDGELVVVLIPDQFSRAEESEWVDRMLAQGHVSLAVSANVLRGDRERAGYHCRRAFELSGSDFNRILYACHLARRGAADRARRLAEPVDVAPNLYYNLACTWALLGQKDRALDLLEKDFAENHLTPRARNLHREWARRDRDLEALRGTERFRRLMAVEKE